MARPAAHSAQLTAQIMRTIYLLRDPRELRSRSWNEGKLGLKPKMEVIETVANYEERERYWIEFYRQIGPLTNLSDGGAGPTGVVRGQGYRENMSRILSGRKRTLNSGLTL